SSCYTHFLPPLIVQAGPKVKYKFVCKRHPNQSCTHNREDNSTSNLIRHVELCSPQNPEVTEKIISFGNGVTYSAPRFRFLLALWCSRHHRPFQIVEDEELVEMFKMLYALFYHRVEIPHPTTISRDVHDMFLLCQKNVISILKGLALSRALHITSWSSPNIYSFLGITIHQFCDGRMLTYILDFIKYVYHLNLLWS
ncbi:hypothetical protein BD779DRAFT_1458867, partial [Infundibulicybe gibba]